MRGCVVLLACLLLAACGSGDGGDDDSDPAAEYDLTGCWKVIELPSCDANARPVTEIEGFQIDFVDPITDAELDELERSFVDAEPLRLRQDGNDLEVTEIASGYRVHGTVRGDQVNYRGREQDLFGFEALWEVRGTALSEDLVALTVTYEFASMEVEGGLDCELHWDRIPDAPRTCIAGPAQ